MGILDDAIREHLELKRQHGAAADDLARLEREAFGPAPRPGDEPPTGMEDEVPGEAEPSAEAETTLQPSEAAEGAEQDPFAHLDEEPEGDDEHSSAEQARIEHSHLQDTVDHPALGGEVLEEAEEYEEAPEAEIFGPEDEVDIDELDLDLDDDPPTGYVAPEPSEPAGTEAEDDFGDDLDLSLDEPEPAVEQPVVPASSEPDPAPFDEQDSESDMDLSLDEPDLDASPDPAPEGGVTADAVEDAVEAPEVTDGAPALSEAADEDEEQDDLLEETPEFLEDAPEGERLWFEQGEPKDFDFDD